MGVEYIRQLLPSYSTYFETLENKPDSTSVNDVVTADELQHYHHAISSGSLHNKAMYKKFKQTAGVFAFYELLNTVKKLGGSYGM